MARNNNSDLSLFKVPLSDFARQWRRNFRWGLLIPVLFTLAVGLLCALFTQNIDPTLSIVLSLLAAVIAATLSFITFSMVQTYQREVWRATVPYYKYIRQSNSFCCTTVIPAVVPDFETWFTAEMVKSLTDVVGRQRRITNYPALRVLVFEETETPRLLAMNTKCAEGNCALRFAQIHCNTGILLAYMTYDDLKQIALAVGFDTNVDAKILDAAVFFSQSRNQVLAYKNQSDRDHSDITGTDEAIKYINLMQNLLSKVLVASTLKTEYDFLHMLKQTA